MHELSIAESLVEVALEHLPPEFDREGGRVRAAHLTLGALAGVDRAALRFSFEVVTAGTPLSGAELVIHDVPVRVYCPTCNAEGQVRDPARLRCPTCDRRCPEVRTGKELHLSALDLAEFAGEAGERMAP